MKFLELESGFSINVGLIDTVEALTESSVKVTVRGTPHVVTWSYALLMQFLNSMDATRTPTPPSGLSAIEQLAVGARVPTP